VARIDLQSTTDGHNDVVIIRWASPPAAIADELDCTLQFHCPRHHAVYSVARREDAPSAAWVFERTSSTNLTLEHLKPATVYVVRINAHMKDAITPITSPMFKFETKEREPIRNLTVSFHTNGDVMLRWVVNPLIGRVQGALELQ